MDSMRPTERVWDMASPIRDALLECLSSTEITLGGPN